MSGNTAAPADASRDNLVDRFAPTAWRPYLRIARIDRPIGWQLLLLPCFWSVGLAAIAAGTEPNLFHAALFTIGAVAMRGAGSAWNDIVDKDLDARVERTRNRPLPSGQISRKAAAAFAGLLCLVGLAVLLSLNSFAIMVGFASLLPVAVYPFMKRITNYPQMVLGLSFAWGALMGWAAAFGQLGAAPLLLYAGAVLWVIGYDTIYALQDIEDDGIVGIRSTARAFGANVPLMVGGCYTSSVVLIASAIAIVDGGWPAWLGLFAFAAHGAWQVSRIDLADPGKALRLFKSNGHSGLLLAAGLFLDALV